MSKFFQGLKGLPVVCRAPGTDGCGNRIHKDQQYVITEVFVGEPQGKDFSNGEAAPITVTVSGDSVNPAAYPFRWGADRFRARDNSEKEARNAAIFNTLALVNDMELEGR